MLQLLATKPNNTLVEPKLIVRNEMTPGMLLSNGIQAFEQRDWIRAESLLQQYLQKVPTNYKAKLTLIETYRQLQKLETALQMTLDMLLIDTENRVLILKVCDLYRCAISTNQIPNEFYSIDIEESILLLVKKIFLFTKREQRASLKSFVYTTSSLEIYCKTLKVLLEKQYSKKLYLEILNLFKPVCESEESYLIYSLHLGYLHLLRRCDRLDELLLYIRYAKDRFAKCLEWLMASHEWVSSRITLGPNPIELLQLSLLIQSDIVYLSIKTQTDVMKFIEMFEKSIIDSDIVLPLDSDDKRQWIGIRQEMLSRLELFKSLAQIQIMPGTIKTTFDHSCLVKALDSLLLSIDYNPSAQLYHSQMRQIDCLWMLKSILYTIKTDRLTHGVSLKKVYVSNDKTFDSVIFLPEWDLNAWSHVKTKRISEGIQKMIQIDTDCLYKDVMLQNPWSLNRIVNIAFWKFNSDHFRNWLTSLFPKMLESHIFVPGDNNLSPITKRNSKTNMKTTVTLVDVQLFLLLLILDRQFYLTKKLDLQSDSELIFATIKSGLWSPNEACICFWEYIVVNYSGRQKPLGNILAPNRVIEILEFLRGSYQKYKIIYGLLGNTFSKFQHREVETLYYLERYKSDQLAIDKDNCLFGEAWKELIADKENSRINEQIDSLWKQLKRPDFVPSTPVKKPTLKNRFLTLQSPGSRPTSTKKVSFEDKLKKQPQTPQIPTNSLPGFWPKTPGSVTAVKFTKEYQYGNTPQMKTTSLPGFFPKTPESSLLSDTRDSFSLTTKNLDNSDVDQESFIIKHENIELSISESECTSFGMDTPDESISIIGHEPVSFAQDVSIVNDSSSLFSDLPLEFKSISFGSRRDRLLSNI